MLIYELLTLHQPFVGYETVKELILEGGRPPLSPRELIYPTYVLDLMVVCWAQQPRERPSASQIVSIASAPEFLRSVILITAIYEYKPFILYDSSLLSILYVSYSSFNFQTC